MIRHYVVAGIALLLSQAAGATPIEYSPGLSAPAATITFDEQSSLQTDDKVTDQFKPQGITFSPYLYFTPDTSSSSPNISGKNVGNFPSTTGTADLESFTLSFVNKQTAAAFAMVSNDADWKFEALLTDKLQESFTTKVLVGSKDDSNNFFGFTGIEFDSIRISGRDQMLLDNVQLGSAGGNGSVPEPATLALIGAAVAGLGFVRRRKMH